MKKLATFLFIMIFSGCASTSMSKISNLQVGMSKDEVRQALGKPYQVRSTTIGEGGALQEVWEYTVYYPTYKNHNPWTGNILYWVKFENEHLVSFGHPGDNLQQLPRQLISVDDSGISHT